MILGLSFLVTHQYTSPQKQRPVQRRLPETTQCLEEGCKRCLKHSLDHIKTISLSTAFPSSHLYSYWSAFKPHTTFKMAYQRGCASLCLAVRDVLDVERDDSFNLALQHSFCSSAETKERHTLGLASVPPPVMPKHFNP